MPLTYKDVSDQYDAAGSTEGLGNWAAKMDQLTGGTQYSEAAHDPLKIKAVSTGIDKLLEATGAPAATEAFGRQVGGLVGAPEAGATIGHGLPRAAVNFAPLLALNVASLGASTPLTVAALGATGALSGAEAYTSTGSPAAGLISGATNIAMPGVAGAAEKYAVGKLGGQLVKGPIADITGKVIQNVDERLPVGFGLAKKAAVLGAGQVAAAGLGEVGTAAQEYFNDQPITNPFSTENLLNLTLGQLPFAGIHLAGKAFGLGGPSAESRMKSLQTAIDESQPRIMAREAAEEIRNRPDISKIPDVEQQQVPPSVMEETQNLLAAVRKQQFKVQNDPNLTDLQKAEEQNKLMQQDADLRRSQNVFVPGAVMGNTIKNSERTEVMGRQVYQNPAGTWRAVLVSNDPSNPPELVGRVIGYSTRDEPAPVSGVQTQETGATKFSLPDQTWWGADKPSYEWFKQTPTIEQTLQGRRAAFVRQVDGTVAEVDQANPLTPEGNVRLASGIVLDREGVADVLDKNRNTLAVTRPLAAGEIATQPDLPPVTATGFGAITTDARNLVASVDAGAPVPPLEQPLRQIALDNNIDIKPDTTPKDIIDALRMKGEVQPMSKEELAGHMQELERLRVAAGSALTPLDIQRVIVGLNAVEGQNGLPLSDDTNLGLLQQSLIDGGMDPAEAVKMAVAVQADIVKAKIPVKVEAQQLTEQELEDEYGNVAAQFEGTGFRRTGATPETSRKGQEESVESKPVTDAELAQAQAAVVMAGTKAQTLFKTVEGNEERSFSTDLRDWMEIASQYRLANLPYDQVADYLNLRGLERTDWSADEVREFMNMPHTQLWTQELDKIQARQQLLNRQQTIATAPIYGTNPNVLGLPKAFAVTGQKDIALIDSQPFRDKVVAGFQGAKRMIDAFSGSGVISRFARWAGFANELVENTIPVKGRILERIQNDPTFAASADALGKKLVALGSNFEAQKDLLAKYPDQDVALFVANNSSTRGREITDMSQYTPHARAQFFGKLKALGNVVNQLRTEIGRVTTEDGWQQVGNAQVGDFVVVDPTYVGAARSGYSTGRDDSDLATAVERVSSVLKPASDRGVKLMYTNAYSPELQKALKSAGFKVDILQRRDYAPELVATNYDVKPNRVVPSPPVEGQQTGIPAGGGFVFGLKPPEAIQGMTRTGVMPETKFQNVGSYSGAFSKGEMNLMQSLVPEAFGNGQVDVNKLAQGLKERGPILETKTLTPEQYQTAQANQVAIDNERQQIIHQLDTQYPSWDSEQKAYVSLSPEEIVRRLDSLPNVEAEIKDSDHGPGYPPKVLSIKTEHGTTEQAIQPGTRYYVSAHDVVDMPRLFPEADYENPETQARRNEPEFQRLLRRYDELAAPAKPTEVAQFGWLGPKRLEQMPGYTELLVKEKTPTLPAEHGYGSGVIGLARLYEVTLPNGEKAIHVFEAQGNRELQKRPQPTFTNKASDVGSWFEDGKWTWKLSDTGWDGRAYDTKEQAKAAAQRKMELIKPTHPFADAYEGLILKAAIQHAQSVGATKLILSDAQTAMMTEGHDKTRTLSITFPTTEARDAFVKSSTRRPKKVGDKVATFTEPGDMFSIADAKRVYGEFGKVDVGGPPQEKGMRLHYDQTLPSAMAKLTGDQGQVIDLGYHKASYGRTELVEDHATAQQVEQYRNNPEYTVVDRGNGYFDVRKVAGPHLQERLGNAPYGNFEELRRQGEANGFVGIRQDASGDVWGSRTGSPVFKDEQGNPKGNVTGRMYDLANVPGEFTVMGRNRQEPTVDFSYAKNELEKQGYQIRKNPGTGDWYTTNKNGTPLVYTPGTELGRMVEAIHAGPTKDTPRWDREPQYIPQGSGEWHVAKGWGFNDSGEGTGTGLVRFLQQHDDPFFSALGKDLAKFVDSAARVRVILRDSAGSYAKYLTESRSEISFAADMLDRSSIAQAHTIAHELIHGLTKLEIDAPANAPLAKELTQLRQTLIDNLPKRLADARNALVAMDWYGKYSRGELRQTQIDAVPQFKLTPEETSIIYALYNDHETLAQGFDKDSFRNYMQSVKAPGQETGFNRFVNLVRAVLGLGEKVNETAFAKFLNLSDRILAVGDYVQSFHDFSERYLMNQGQSGDALWYGTRRAMSVLANTYNGASANLLLVEAMGGRTGIKSPAFGEASRQLQAAFIKNDADTDTMKAVLGEHSYATLSPAGFTQMARDMLFGNIESHGDVLAVLPPAATSYIYEIARDAKLILGTISAGVSEQNKGFLNIANPDEVRGPVKQALKQIDKVLQYEQVEKEATTVVQGLSSIPPSGHLANITANPEELPTFVTDTAKPLGKDNVFWTFFEPIGQWARRVPEIAQAVAKGWQLAANARKMAMEAFKVFGTDLETGELTKGSVKLFAKMLEIPKLTKAADRWIHTNQVEGKAKESVQMLDADHPKIQEILAPLSSAEREQVEEIVQKHQMSQQQTQAQNLEMTLRIGSAYGATLLKLPVAQGTELTSTLLNALRVDRSDPNASAAADAQIQQVAAKMQPEEFNKLLKYSMAVVSDWNVLKDFYQKNPAWSSGQRYGKYLARFADGQVHGVDSKKEAESMARDLKTQLKVMEPNQRDDSNIAPNLGPDTVAATTKLRESLQTQMDMLASSGNYTKDELEQIRKTSPVEALVTQEAYRGGIPGLRPEARGLTRGAENLPWFRNHLSWVNKNSTYWSRRLFRAETYAQLMDPSIQANPDMQVKLRTHFENMLTPDTATGHFFQRFASNWFMGFNPASAIVNATQPFLTHVAEFTAMTGKPVDSYRRVIGAMREAINYYKTGSWGSPDHDWLMHKATQDGERNISMYDDRAAEQESVATNLKRRLDGQRVRTLGQQLGNVWGVWSKVGMMMFRGVEQMNADIALLASFDYHRALEPNLSRNEAYEKALQFHHAVNYGGGAAQRPITPFSGRGPFPRTVEMLSTSMQSYVLGSTSQLARYISKGFFRPEGLTPAEVFASRKAAVQMLAIQLASAGVLGLPFVSGALALLNKAFPDLEPNRHLREWMNEIMGGDEENGHILGDAAMVGLPSMFGWDMQSRLSMGNTLPGVSEVNGFEPENLLGPPENLVSSFVKGGQRISQGDIAQGIDQLVPSALKKILQLAQSRGQVQDYQGRPIFTPTRGEKVGIGLGFQPKRLTDFNNAQRIAKQAQDNVSRQQSEFNQQMAREVLKGNFGTVQAELRKKIQDDPNFKPRDAVKAITNATEDLTFPRDLRREGTQKASDVRSRLLSTFNLPPTLPDETRRLAFRQQVERRLGLPVSSGSDQVLASVMDQLRRQQPEASRSELRRQSELLLRGRRPQTLALQ